MSTEYNQDLDRTLWEKTVDISNPMSRTPQKFKFCLRVMQYDYGKKKLDIKRLNYGRGSEGVYVKTGRFSEYELTKLMPVFQEALDYMENH